MRKLLHIFPCILKSDLICFFLNRSWWVNIFFDNIMHLCNSFIHLRMLFGKVLYFMKNGIWSRTFFALNIMRVTPCTHHGHIFHYNDVIMGTMASQITSLMVVYSTVYSDADKRRHQSSASLAFVWGIHQDRWIPRTNGQLRGKYFHLMTSSWLSQIPQTTHQAI